MIETIYRIFQKYKKQLIEDFNQYFSSQKLSLQFH